METPANAPLGKDVMGLAAVFVTSGILHFARPEPFESMVPKQLPSRRALVYASGAAEIACAVGLLIPRTRRVAGFASAALLVAVFPANVAMTGQAKQRLDGNGDSARSQGYLA